MRILRPHLVRINVSRFVTRTMSSSRFRVVEHTVNCQHTREYPAATANGDRDTPKLAVKQYIPLDYADPRPDDVTIVGAHANGFPKVTSSCQYVCIVRYD